MRGLVRSEHVIDLSYPNRWAILREVGAAPREVYVDDVAELNLPLAGYSCSGCGTAFRYVPSYSKRRAYFGLTNAACSRHAHQCPQSLVTVMITRIRKLREIDLTLFSDTKKKGTYTMQLEVLVENVPHPDPDQPDRPRFPATRHRGAIRTALRQLSSARDVLALMLAAQRSGVVALSEILSLCWKGHIVPWHRFYYAPCRLDDLRNALAEGTLNHPVAFVVPDAQFAETRYGYSMAGMYRKVYADKRERCTRVFMNSPRPRVFTRGMVSRDLLAFGCPFVAGSTMLRLHVHSRAQISIVPKMYRRPVQDLAAE